MIIMIIIRVARVVTTGYEKKKSNDQTLVTYGSYAHVLNIY